MTLVSLIVFVLLVGILVTFVKVEGRMLNLAYGLVVLLVIVVLLHMFGLFPSFRGLP